ncbi:16S rRNA (guanine(966)-N(2))-methyltransferase RsmD [Kiritimatiellaeota bacterium B1221]|nr:16S rRNA (guanine(966)-N(2))-methyltransferase RsmD [Kiritimatiellaeota bacterium B1221]
MKITGGLAGGIPIDVLKGNRTRPTTDRIRESMFGSLRDRVEDARVLDLFSGSGALGLEAASRGASRVDLVEKHAGTCKNIERNAGKLGKAGVKAVLKVHCHDSTRFIKSSSVEAVDLLFVDPPYTYFEAKGSYEDFMTAVLKSKVLKKDGLMVVESSSRVKPGENSGWTCIKEKNYGASTLRYWQLA